MNISKETLRHRGDPGNWHTLQQDVIGFKEKVCASSNAHQFRTDCHRLFYTGAIVMAGVGVTTLNASTDVVTTFGLLPWMTMLLGALGDRLVDRGLGE